MKKRMGVAGIVISAMTLVGIGLHEGYRGEAYIPVKGDVPTIGFGETKSVKMGQKTTPERALSRLLTSVEEHADGIRQCIAVPLHQYEFDAYVSLSYNIGVGAFCRSTLVKKLNAGDYAGACQEIRRWDRSGGRVLPGLTARRQKEYQQCMGAQ